MAPNTLEYKAVYLQYCVEEIIFTRTPEDTRGSGIRFIKREVR